MLGLFKTQKSPVRRRLETNVSVLRSWFEWTVENGTPEPTLVVELAFETDPGAPNFDRAAIDDVMKAVAARPGETAPAHVKLIPRKYEA